MSKLTFKYNAFWGTDNAAAIELGCIARLGNWKDEEGKDCGNGLFHHVYEFQKIAWPSKYWHRWNRDLLLPELCKPGRLAIFGPSSSGKSLEFSMFALTMFYARPKGTPDRPGGTTVLISSTTLPSLKRRIWGYVVEMNKEARRNIPGLPGHLIESSQMLLADPSTADGRSYKDGIVGVACRSGGKWQGLEEYVGTKNAVFILGADECSMMAPGFWDSLANLESNDVCFAVALGNLDDIHNPLATAAEPKMGFDSLPDTLKSRVYNTKWFNGRAIQLIGSDSPNLDFPEGKEPYKNLIGRRYIAQCAHNYGVESDRYNVFAMGKIPKSSVHKTVFSKSQCYKFHAFEGVNWGSHALVKGYMLDAAYGGVGGDRTAGGTFTFGRDAQGAWKFMCGVTRVFPGTNTPKLSHSEFIALEVRAACEVEGIEPSHVFYDGTGRSDLTSAFARLWSPNIVPIQFGAPATERPGFFGERHLHGALQGEPRTCRDSYDRFVTELWFALGACIVSDQMRGLSEEAADEGSQRKWEDARGYKQAVETKDEMRERGLRSPDLCDMIVCGIEGARRLGFPLGESASIKPRLKQHGWIAQMRSQQQEDFQEDQLASV